jgi:hypothetical protein
MRQNMKSKAVIAAVWIGLILCQASSHALGQATSDASSQPAKAGSNWERVRALPAATNIDVKATTGHVHCKVTRVTEDTLVCLHGETSTTFERVNIRSIKIDHRGRSALIGGAIGGGGLAIAGVAVTSGGSKDSFFGSNFLRGPVTAGALGVGAVLGGGIGALTDFSKSTVYKAP